MRKDLKNTTESVRRRHIWKPFSVRIEQVKIDVGRRIERIGAIEAETESYFVTGLQKWSELNLTIPFSEFLQQVDKKAKTLAQIVHLQREIFDALKVGILKADPLSLGALLDLLVQFIRDLQGDFEPYVPETIATLVPLTKSASVEVVESTFTTFAYLFKYLYRPLSANPIPVFDAFAVLLGRDEPKKQYIVRFAAESLSFLLRRTRSQTQQDFIRHILGDLQAHANCSDYIEGVSYLLAETIKGVDHSLHAKGLVLFENILSVVQSQADMIPEDSVATNVLENVTINLLHHCTRESYAPILSLYSNLIKQQDRLRDLGWRMSFISVAVRKGTRIDDWVSLLRVLQESLDTVEPDSAWNAVRLASVLYTYAPHEAILQVSHRLLSNLTRQDVGHFLSFSSILAKQHLENFITFVLPTYRSFVNEHWSAVNEGKIMRSVIDLSKLQAFKDETSAAVGGKLRLGERNVEDVASSIVSLRLSKQNQAYARVLVQFSGAVTGEDKSVPAMVALLSQCLKGRDTASNTRKFSLLIGTLLEILSKSKAWDAASMASVMSKHQGLWHSTSFLKGYASLAFRHSLGMTTDHMTQALMENLSGPGHYRRLYSLQILQCLTLKFSQVDRDMLSVCEIIESTGLTIDATRSLAMQIRKLNQNYPILDNEITKMVIARFSLGLMTGNYTPFWSYCSETLGVVAQTDPDLVWSLAKDWFDCTTFNLGDDEAVVESPSEDLQISEAKLDSFRCFNTAELRQNCVNTRHNVTNHEKAATVEYSEGARHEDEERYVSRRHQAMRVFSAIPGIAEQHSRDLVPVFLSEFGSSVDDEEDDDDVVDAEDDVESEETSVTVQSSQPLQRFNKKERNELLTLFTKFNNPAAFVQAERVRELVMDLLGSRDSRTQALAFEILLHYRDQTLKRYEDNLKNLLSDTRSRDEITTFLQSDADDTVIQDEHRRYVIPVVARILFGKMINRRHANSQKKGLTNSRTIILGAVASMPLEDIGEFIELFLRPFRDLGVVNKSEKVYKLDKVTEEDSISLRKQIGFCTMIQDAMEQLAGKMLPYVGQVLDALIYCYTSASEILEGLMNTNDHSIKIKIARNIRHSAYQTLDMLFQYCRSYNWSPYHHIIFDLFINPRLDKLPNESSQNPSGLLKLLSNWASSPSTSPLLVLYNDHVLIKVFDCLAEKSIKSQVAIFVLNMVQTLCDQVKDTTVELSLEVRQSLLPNKVETFLDRMAVLLETQQISSTNNTINSDFLELEIDVLSSISSLVSGGAAIQKLLDLLMPLLQKPRKLVPDSVKENILQIVENFLPLCQDYAESSDMMWKKYNVIGTLFSTCASKASRSSLSNIMAIFAIKDASLNLSASIIEDLNSFSKRRLDTPDFDRRLAAFAKLNESDYSELSAKAWRPLLHNMIFFVGDEEELALRTNAVYSIRRFLELTKNMEPEGQKIFLRLLETDLYPAVKKGMRHRLEIIRQEWVGILGSIVRECSSWPQVSDMVPLLVGNDEEANFFYNILHIQQHRRMRALRRLATISQKHEIQSNNIAQVILPLIEHYCFAPREESHNLIAETIKTIGQLAKSLKFNQYCALLKRYIGLLKPSESTQATVVRLIGAVVDALVGTPDVATDLVDYLQDDVEESNVEETNVEIDVAMEVPPNTSVSVLQSSAPSAEKVNDAIMNGFLPHLTKYLHSKDDDTVSLRVPVAETVVKLLAALPHEALTMKLPGVLTDICHILRSRSQDARDMTRKTLGSIATLLGPKYFSYILAELKAALQRGYQLHVLGFSIHTILIKLQPEHGSLDYCLTQIVDMLVDDIFGETGAEKDAEEYITKMKEMKSTKSYDSFEILASTTKLQNLGEIIWPLKTLLAETSSLKIIRKIDEVFRRLTLGVLRNAGCDSRDSLLFCYNVYQQTIASSQAKVAKTLSIQEQARKDAEKNYVVDLKARKSFIRDHFKANAHKLLKFSLESLRAILQKHSQLQTPANLAAFIPMIGDSMLSGYEDVHMSALRLLTQIIKVDLPALDSGSPVFLEQAVGFIKSSPSTKTEICQASLKFISAILKERKNVTVKDSVLAYLLIRIQADIEEPDRQGVTFSILRSIMSRRFMVPELYDVMDDVGTMMVTNQSSGPRDTARSAYFQFLSDYPQGKGRLKKQMTFLIKNLEYIHSTGRKSVMEALNLIMTQFDDTILQEYLPMLYLAFTMALINDDDSSCREMAAALIRKLIERADKERMTSVISALKSWSYNDQIMLQRAALQGFGLFFEIKQGQKEEVRFFMDKFQAVLTESIKEESVDEQEADDGVTDGADTRWQLLYYGLQTFSKVLSISQTTYITIKYATLWSNIQKLLLYKHAWVRLSASRLIGLLFASRQVTESRILVAGKDLQLQEIDLVRIARHSLIQLRSPFLSEDLGTQITKNLIFLLRFFHEKSTILPPREDQVVNGEADADVDADGEDGDKQGNGDETPPTCVAWLIKRVTTLLQSDRDVKRDTTTLVRRLGLQFLALTIRILSVSELHAQSRVIMRPLYKYTTTQTSESSLTDLSQELLDTLKVKLGTTQFVESYNAVRQHQLALQQERKQKRTVEMVRFPERGAMKKVKAALKKRERRSEVSSMNKKRREMRQ